MFKGLYKKARQGQLKNFTGIDSPYEGTGEPRDPPLIRPSECGRSRTADPR